MAYLNKPFQGLRSAEVVSELVSEQENITSTGKLWSQQGLPAMHWMHFTSPLTSLQDPVRVLIEQNNENNNRSAT